MHPCLFNGVTVMSSVNLQRRTFLAQAGAGAAVLTAGSLLGSANASASAAQAGQSRVGTGCAPGQGWFLARRHTACGLDLDAVRGRWATAEGHRQPVSQSGLPRQRARRPGHQYLVRLWLPRRHSQAARPLGPAWGEGHQPHDRRCGEAASGSWPGKSSRADTRRRAMARAGVRNLP